MWSQLFTKQPTDVFDVANDTMSSLNKLRDQRISNALKQIKLNYAPQMAQSAASKASAEASSAQNTAKYAPQMSLANLARIHAETSHENAMTDFAKAERAKSYLQDEGIKSDNAIKAAQAQGASEKVKNALQLQQAQIQMTYAKANAASNSAASNAIKTIPATDRGRWLAAHPEYVAHLSKLSNQLSSGGNSPQAANTPAGNAPTAASQDAASAPAPFNPMGDMSGQNDPNAPPAPQQQDAPPNAAPPMIAAPQAPTQPQAQTSLPQIAPSEPQAQLSQADQTFQLGNQLEANKKAVSPSTYKKAESAAELDKLYEDPTMIRRVKNAAYYVGPEGKLRAAHDAIFAPNSQRYNDYLTFHNQMPTTLANVMRYMDGMGVQIKSREELLDNFTKAFNNPIGTPDQALQQWDNLRQTNRAVMKASLNLAQPLYPGTLEKANGIDLNKPFMHLSKNSHDVGDEDKTIKMKAPNGKKWNVPKDMVKEAIAKGWEEIK